MTQPVSIHSKDELAIAFAAVKKPRRWVSVDLPTDGVSVGPVKVGFTKETIRNCTKNSRFYGAAWAWLRPEIPRKLQELEVLQARVGLGHIPKSAFCAGMAEHCREIMRDYAALVPWGKSRLALLEYEGVARPIIPALLRDSAIGLRTENMGAVVSMFVDPETAREKASQIVKHALRGAAQVALHILGKKTTDCFLTANLMLPVATENAAAPRYAPNEVAIENSRKASELWRGENWRRALIVAGETADNTNQETEHLGFWCPIVRKGNGDALPGAPTAFIKMHGDAVFKDDLPMMPSFDSALSARWRAYMGTSLEERLFVSLPLLIPLPTGQGSRAVAVLNVNVDPPEDDDWCRAHHQEWLGLAMNACRSFSEVAFRCLQVIMTIDGSTGNAKLLAGPDRWNTLPGLNSPLHLPGGATDGSEDEKPKLNLPAPEKGTVEGETEST